MKSDEFKRSLPLGHEHAVTSTSEVLGGVDELYRLLVESVTDYAIFVLDPAGHIRSWNPGAARLKGYVADEIIGRHFSTFYPEDDVLAGKPGRELETAAKTGRLEDEGWRVRKDGSRFWANVVITALRGDDGSLVGFAKITRDLTERRNAEEQARRLAGESAARAEAERHSAELARLNDELQQQAAELESQTDEAQALTEEVEQANEQLRETNDFVEGIVASITDPLVVHDGDWRLRYLNPAAAALYERARAVKASTVIGQSLWDVYHGVRGTPFEREIQRAATERVPVTVESFVSQRSEWWEMSCYPLADGGLVIRWKDITARKQTEEAARYLAKASEILAASIDYATTLDELAHLVVPDLAEWCTVDLVGEDGGAHQVAVAHVDPAKAQWAKELSKRYPPNPNAPSGVPHVLRTGQAELYRQIPDELLASGAVDEEHLRILRELGLRSAMIVPLKVQDRVLGALTLASPASGRGYTDGDFALAQELARRAALAVENARLHRAALEANAAKSRFLAVMSHELRTPLNAIAGYAELLSMGLRGPVTPEQIVDLDRITRNERTLLSFVNDILNYARLEAGQVRYAVERVCVRELLADLESLVAPQLGSKQIRFGVADCDPRLVVRADPDKVRQIFVNLLSNAIKFTPVGGAIDVDCNEDGASVRIQVRDTGVGIPADKLETIFEPFVQLDPALTSTHEGSGLGLAISRDLARGMGGDLRAESLPSTGATFVLTLPRAV